MLYYMSDIFDKYDYMMRVPKSTNVYEWVNNLKKIRGMKTSDVVCRECNIERTALKDGSIVCDNCGQINDYQYSQEYYKKPQTYKRLTHFIDWITKTQAKHCPQIDPKIIELCKNNNDKSYKGIKSTLKKNNGQKYYEDIYFIISIVNPDYEIMKLSVDEEKKLILLFTRINFVWGTIKPLRRKSLISYSYIITELLDMIGRSDLKKHFNLPRYNKVLEYKTQWKRIINNPLFYQYS